MFVYEAKLTYEATLFKVSTNRLTSAELVVAYMKDIPHQFPVNETFWVILVNRKNAALGRHMCTLGTQTAALAHPREVFRPAIIGGAAAIVCWHWHPSGDPTPSAADIQITRQLREASKAVDIALLDHVIHGDAEQDGAGKGYYSFREAGIL